jgi:hypothetical protein
MSADDPGAVLEHRSLETLLQPDTVIEGGHYIAGEAVDSLCEWSWEKAVELYAQASRLGMPGIGLMLLVEDFNVAAAERNHYHANYQLPPSYRRALDARHVDPDTVIVTWETQLRNRANGDLRRRLKPRLTWQGDGYITRAQDGTQRRVTRGTVPVCNFIMARYIADKDRLYKNSLNLYDLKWECESNGGVVVSRSLYDTQITVFNAFVTPALQIGFVVRHQKREPSVLIQTA